VSSGKPLPWEDAFRIAGEVSKHLQPHCVRLKAAGSLRRRRPEVSDIDFVCEPRMVTADLFGTQVADVDPIRAALVYIGTWVRGGERMMQITDVFGRAGLKCEIHLVWPPAQWGSLLAIYTGPWELGRHAVTAMQRLGYRHEDGHVVEAATGRTIPTPDEADFFRLAGLPCWAPAFRENLWTRIEAGEKLTPEVAYAS
jgi:DNA polymerase/3'-5' exonuclease PolX